MELNDSVRIKAGRLKGCEGIIVEVIPDNDAPVYAVALREVSAPAHQAGWRFDDVAELDRHELEIKP